MIRHYQDKVSWCINANTFVKLTLARFGNIGTEIFKVGVKHI